MRNSEKLKLIIFFIVLTVLLVSIFKQFTIFVILFILYLFFNVFVVLQFPFKKDFFERRDELEIEKECKEYIKNAKYELITITYWWNRFIYYLDYELNNKTQNEEK